MRVNRSALTAFLVTLALNGGAMAATWHVEKDGSGDFAFIQDAVNASADGDTIRIGPGRYEEYQRYDIGAWRDEAIFVLLDGRSLTMIGSGEGSTVIGPSVLFDPAEHEKGVVLFHGSSLEMSDLSIDGIYSGVQIWQYSSAAIQRCTFQSEGYGVGCSVFESIESRFTNCTFIGYNTGVGPHAGSVDVRVENCIFREVSYAVNTWNTTGLAVDGCRVEDSLAGVQLYLESDATITGLTADCRGPCVIVESNSHATIENSDLNSAALATLWLSSSSTVTGHGIHFFNSGGPCVRLFRSGAVITDSHLSTGAQYAVECVPYSQAEPWTADLRNNWWGVSDAESIDALIYDGNDDPEIGVIVQYFPFRDEQVSNEAMNWGDLKRHYR